MNRSHRNIKKFFDEERHYRYLLARGMDNLEIADQLIHILLSAMREGIINKYPDADEAEIRARMLKQANYYHNLKKLRRRKMNGGS